MIHVIVTTLFEFFHNSYWFAHNKIVDRSIDGVMLKKTNNGGYSKK